MNNVTELAVATPANVVKPGQAPSHWVLTDRVSFYATCEQTDSAYVVAETVVQPGGGPPPHVHHREHELMYILEGTFWMLIGEHGSRASAGEAVFLPRGVVHTFRNVGETAGRILTVAMPGGFDRFISDAGSAVTDPAAAPPAVDAAAIEKLTQAARKHGLELRPAWKAEKPAPPRPRPKELWVIGLHVKVLLRSEDTRSRFSVVELTVAPGDFVPPHVHLREDELFYVLEGTFEFEIEQQRVTAPAGTFVRVPRGTMHGFRNVGTSPAKLADYHTPGGFERFFEAAGTACEDATQGPPAGEVDFEAFIRICRDHGMEMTAPAEVSSAA